MVQKTLSIFTPAYNRAHTLIRTYESLCRQTCLDFEWLIIDDGSSDQTTTIVKSWLNEPTAYDDAKPGLKAIIIDSFQGKCKTGFLIRYIKQKNQGMHGAHNTAYRNITTELNTCIDSDDWMPENAVEKIISFWRKNGSERYAGILGLDVSTNGHIIGSNFPDYLSETTLRGYYENSGGKGDKKIVYRTDVVKQCPEYPIFEGERYVGLAYKYHLIDLDYSLLTINSVLVIVDYQEDGSSFGMWKQYWNNPQGFAFYRRIDMIQTKSWNRKVMDNIHYVSHSIRSKNARFIKESPLKSLTILLIIPGFFLYLINRYKIKYNRLYQTK